MDIRIKRVWVQIVWSALLLMMFTVTLTACSTAAFKSPQGAEPSRLSAERIQELRDQYPVYSGVPPLINMREVSFREIMNYADAVIVAEVIGDHPPFSVELTAEPGTSEGALAEKQRNQGLSPDEPEFTAYQVKVLEVVSGEDVPENTFLFYNAVFAGIEPELKPGMRIVTAVGKGTAGGQIGGYSFSRSGTYYIVDEDYVLAAYEGQTEDVRDFTDQTNGIRLGAMMRIIKDIGREAASNDRPHPRGRCHPIVTWVHRPSYIQRLL
ncbi:hypothetical protein [Paenibacillus sp. FSL R7-0652]|uniref:Uncharacterized protein n=1 Tax=Paenibacillus sp. AN1007 TaxID=3151385 RepID=A0AAU8NDV8_9BACL